MSIINDMNASVNQNDKDMNKRRSKNRLKRKKKKKQKHPTKLIRVQCPHCHNLFSSVGCDYEIHLTQCQIVLQSDLFQIRQENTLLKPNVSFSENNVLSFSRNEISRISFGLFDGKRKDDLFSKMKWPNKPLNTQSDANNKTKTIVDNDTVVKTVSRSISLSDYEDDPSPYILHEQAWSLFENVVSVALKNHECIQVRHIPFPPEDVGGIDDLFEIFGLSMVIPFHMKRARMKKHMMRW